MAERYALHLAEDGRILSATYERFAAKDAVLVDALPEGSLADYRYVDGQYLWEPLPEPEEIPTAQDDTDAILVDHEYRLTLLELGLTEE